MLLKFSPIKNNAKLNWIKDGFSISLLSGWSCPSAHVCKSQAVQTKDGLRIKDGLSTKFRCYSASQEILYRVTYLQRKYNFELLKKYSQSKSNMVELIQKSLPNRSKVIRWHIAGDFFNQYYFDAFLEIAQRNPDKIFYAYTKSLNFWVKRLDKIPQNVRLTASEGGLQDALISKYDLRYCKVVASEYEARKLGLPVDTNDKYAMLNKYKDTNFALVVHGTMPKGSRYARIWNEQIRGKRKFHGYSNNKVHF